MTSKINEKILSKLSAYLIRRGPPSLSLLCGSAHVRCSLARVRRKKKSNYFLEFPSKVFFSILDTSISFAS